MIQTVEPVLKAPTSRHKGAVMTMRELKRGQAAFSYIFIALPIVIVVSQFLRKGMIHIAQWNF